MNKTGIIDRMVEVTNYNREDCEKAVNIIEENPHIGKGRKEATTKDLIDAEFSEEESKKLLVAFESIFRNAVKEKLKHPFGSGREV